MSPVRGMWKRFLGSRTVRTASVIGAECLAALALLYALRQIAVKCALYLAGQHGPDATLYWTMGNAIRNGLVIYKDIYDPKPPGMFLLSAASFSLFGDGRLGYGLSVLVLLGIPALCVAWGAAYTKGLRWPRRFSLLQLSLLVGLTLALYNAAIGGEWQTEYYGAFCGLLYVAALEGHRRRARAGWVALACASFAVTLLLKEPFLITLSVCALLLLRTRREWLRLWLLPLLSACALYVIALVALGAFESYFAFYLHGILGGYILRGGPVWARGVTAWEFIYRDVKDFTPWFPLLVAALAVASLPAAGAKRERWLAVSAACACVSLLLLARSFFPAQFPWHVSTGIASILLILSLIGAGASAAPPVLRHSATRTWRHALALYLTYTAIGLGADFHGQYFAIAIPVYAVFLLLILRKLSSDLLPPRQAIGTALALGALSSFVLLRSVSFLAPGPLAEQTAAIRAEETRDRAAAAAVDALLDACAIDRYYFLEGRDYAPYAAHSPLNFYLYTRLEHLDRYHPVYFDESFRRLAQAKILIESKPYAPDPKQGNAREECIGASVKAFVDGKFTETPWPCAKSVQQPRGYRVLFRKDPAGTASVHFESGSCLPFTQKAKP